MGKFSMIINATGMTVSFFCFLHCILVILVFSELLTSNLLIIKVFEDPSNHAWLISSGLILAALSLMKFNLTDSGQKKSLDFTGLLSQPFLIGGSLLGLSFFVSEIYSELLVIIGALTLLSMHIKKLLRIK